MSVAQGVNLPVQELGALRARPARLGAIGRFARAQPLGMASAIILLALVLTAIFADVIAPYAPNENNPEAALSGPSRQHLAGTDQFGRDIFSRVIVGARLSLYIGLTATLVTTFFA